MTIGSISSRDFVTINAIKAVISVGRFKFNTRDRFKENLKKVSIKRLAIANLSRTPAAMAPLALVLAEGHSRRALAAGSILVSTFTVGEILLSSRLARLGDTMNPRSALIRLMVPLALLWSVFGLLAPSYRDPVFFVALAVISFVIGGFGAGLFGIARHLVVGGLDRPRLISLERLMAIDTSFMEAFFFVSPMLVSLAIIIGGPQFAAFAVALVVAATVFVAFRLRLEPPTLAREEAGNGDIATRLQSVWLSRRRAWVFVASGAMGISEGGLVVAIPIILLERHLNIALSGVVVGLISVGSIVGGLAIARRPNLISWISIRPRLSLLLLGLSIGVVVIASMRTALGICLATVVTGVFVAPLNTTRALAMESLVSQEQKAEGFGALFGSYSIGFAMVGLMLGAFSQDVPAGALLVAMSFGSVLVALFLLVSKPLQRPAGPSFIETI